MMYNTEVLNSTHRRDMMDQKMKRKVLCTHGT